jgi:hypothetical protein
MNNKRFLKSGSRILPVLIVLGLLVYQYYVPGSQTADQEVIAQQGRLQQAYAAGQSGIWLETSGRISRILRDDNDGSRHQKFILELDDGHTVMVAHNIDLARRIPARENLSLEIRGRYEWNERGGVIHWTHHDPDGRLQGGWIEVDNVRYQ